MTHFNEGASMASKFLMLSSKTVRIDSKYRVEGGPSGRGQIKGSAAVKTLPLAGFEILTGAAIGKDTSRDQNLGERARLP